MAKKTLRERMIENSRGLGISSVDGVINPLRKFPIISEDEVLVEFDYDSRRNLFNNSYSNRRFSKRARITRGYR